MKKEVENNNDSFFDNKFVYDVAKTIMPDDRTVSAAAAEAIAQRVQKSLHELVRYSAQNRIVCARKNITREDVVAAAETLGIHKDSKFVRERFSVPMCRESVCKNPRQPATLKELQSSVRPLKPSADIVVTSEWLVIDGLAANAQAEEVPMELSFEEKPVIDRLMIKQVATTLPKTEKIALSNPPSHNMTVEQQVLFRTLIEGVVNSDAKFRMWSCRLIQRDPGMQGILPRLINAVTESITVNLIRGEISFVIYFIRVIDSLIKNPYVNLQPHLHELIPIVFSCLFVHQIRREYHLAACRLKDSCGQLLRRFYLKYRFEMMRERIINVLMDAYDRQNKHLFFFYGLMTATVQFGPEYIESMLCPRLPIIRSILAHTDQKHRDMNDNLTVDKKHTREIVFKAISILINSGRVKDTSAAGLEEKFGPFGAEFYASMKKSAATTVSAT